MLFRRMVMTVLNLNQLLHWTEMATAYLCKLISDIFLAINRGHEPKNGIWNNPIGLDILLLYHSIDLKVEDYEMLAGLILGSLVLLFLGGYILGGSHYFLSFLCDVFLLYLFPNGIYVYLFILMIHNWSHRFHCE